MAQEGTTTSGKDLVKIVIMGLDNSGKSSILLSMTPSTNLMSYFSLRPTIGIDITRVDHENQSYTIWEFGGQKQFREDYITNLKKYLEKVDSIIYIIDVQDIKRYDESLDYLKEILQSLKEPLQINLLVYLHKFDPNLEKSDNFTDEKIDARLITKIKDLVPAELKFNIFRTSIYTLFEKTIIC